MIQPLAHASTFFAAFCSVIAAYYWFRASRVEAPRELQGGSGYGGAVTMYTGALVEFVRESGRFSKAAAGWSAATAFFAFLAWSVGLARAHIGG